jgi:hypothetical protein
MLCGDPQPFRWVNLYRMNSGTADALLQRRQEDELHHLYFAAAKDKAITLSHST